ncbi:MAG: hypothetical protein IJV67_06505 [Clostridia bacterium]|nr:hypothetical protein [Clostridia bacterium]
MLAKIINKKVVLEQGDVVCGERGVDKIYFTVPCKYGESSLENMNAFIRAENALGGAFKEQLLVEKEGESLTVCWIIDGLATAVSGLLRCQISFESSDSEVIFITNVFEVEVQSSVDVNGDLITDLIPSNISVVESVKAELMQEIGLINTHLSQTVKKGDNLSELVNDSGFITSAQADEKYALISDCESKYAVRIYQNASLMVGAAKLENSPIKYGDVVKITTGSVPDLVFARLSTVYNDFSYTSDAAIVSQIKQNGYLAIGYCLFYPVRAFGFGLPVPTANDSGKVLSVNASGEWELVSI